MLHLKHFYVEICVQLYVYRLIDAKLYPVQVLNTVLSRVCPTF